MADAPRVHGVTRELIIALLFGAPMLYGVLRVLSARVDSIARAARRR